MCPWPLRVRSVRYKGWAGACRSPEMFTLAAIVQTGAAYPSTAELETRRRVVQRYELGDDTDSVRFWECVDGAASVVKRAAPVPEEGSDREHLMFVSTDRGHEADIYWQASSRWRAEMPRWTVTDVLDHVRASDDTPATKRCEYTFGFFNQHAQLVFSSAAEEMEFYGALLAHVDL